MNDYNDRNVRFTSTDHEYYDHLRTMNIIIHHD